MRAATSFKTATQMPNAFSKRQVGVIFVGMSLRYYLFIDTYRFLNSLYSLKLSFYAPIFTFGIKVSVVSWVELSDLFQHFSFLSYAKSG